MSKDKSKTSEGADQTSPATPQTQNQRRLKYGGNVALAVLLVALLAAGGIYLGNRYHHRSDMTSQGLYSLKRQTVNVISSNQTPIRLISLYTTASDNSKLNEYAGRVADLLNEYKSKGKNITVELIDPVRESGKINALVDDLNSHDPQIAKYKALIADYQKAEGQLRQVILDEATRMAALPINQLQSADSDSIVPEIAAALPKMAQGLEDANNSITRIMEKNPPEYSTATQLIHDVVENLQHNSLAIATQYAQTKPSKDVPKAVTDYMAEAVGRWKGIEAQCKTLLDEAQGLGELKIDSISTSLNEGQSVLVISPTDVRVLPFERIWPEVTALTGVSDDVSKLQRQFAGEQEISTAILSLTTKVKPTVVFVRSGGQPFADASGPYGLVAARLEQYNFNVLEKDFSGQWQMQAQMRGMQAAPEATDAQLKDAVWVVLPELSANQTRQMQPTIMPKVMDHLAAGGSALLLFDYQTDPMSTLLDEWGIQVHTDAIVAHPEITGGSADDSDLVGQYARKSLYWIRNSYGPAPLADPLKSLSSLMLRVCPVTLGDPAKVKDTHLWPIMPFPETPSAWGEKDPKTIEATSNAIYSSSEDLPGPMSAGAAAEKANGSRLVVMGSLYYPFSAIQTFPDLEALNRGQFIPRFPGNSELFMNQVFWLSKMDTMIAISPASMTVSRIAPMSDRTRLIWGVVLIGVLPLVVLVSGIVVAMRRRG